MIAARQSTIPDWLRHNANMMLRVCNYDTQAALKRLDEENRGVIHLYEDENNRDNWVVFAYRNYSLMYLLIKNP